MFSCEAIASVLVFSVEYLLSLMPVGVGVEDLRDDNVLNLLTVASSGSSSHQALISRMQSSFGDVRDRVATRSMPVSPGATLGPRSTGDLLELVRESSVVG